MTDLNRATAKRLAKKHYYEDTLSDAIYSALQIAEKRGEVLERIKQLGPQTPAPKQERTDNTGSERWLQYLTETGNLSRYDGCCDCRSCREIVAGYKNWTPAPKQEETRCDRCSVTPCDGEYEHGAKDCTRFVAKTPAPEQESCTCDADCDDPCPVHGRKETEADVQRICGDCFKLLNGQPPCVECFELWAKTPAPKQASEADKLLLRGLADAPQSAAYGFILRVIRCYLINHGLINERGERTK
jgi:hypothetical protein